MVSLFWDERECVVERWSEKARNSEVSLENAPRRRASVILKDLNCKMIWLGNSFLARFV